ncbi:hypothetical protein DXD13_15940 [Agathobacter rectalis]|uniref:Uncharacterized protein n=5 Tax=Agathobacter rectalis TaxID=39491 RepID=A0A3E4LL32_9FIRM|nr:pre-toxin TG domain-containing protein [Agathobacter rectalis]RGK38207.1 hypothetical protein DXD13_15940 [Agathobacter rectalis]
MEEEIKKAYMDWSEKGVSYLNCMYVYDTMMDVDEALQTCDTILDEIDLGIDYTSRKKDIDRLLEGHGTLHRYIDVLNCYVDDKLDQPLKKDFKKNATETISRIHLEDFEVDNTLGLTENNYITGGMGYAGTMVEQEKAKLTFADFIGTSDGKADGNGLHISYTNGSVEDFASIFAAQYEAMKASGALGEDNNLTQQEFLEQFYRQGEFTHDSSNPFLNFVSSVLDITIIKPVIESCIGEDLITGEDLTDMERGLKVVFAVVDLVTLGGAIAATKFSEMGLKEGLKAFGKTALIDFVGNTAACGVGALGETFDWPVPVTMMLSLAAGITVSISGNKLLFKNADGIEIGSKTLSDAEVKKIGDALDETTKSSFANKNLGEVLKQQGLTLEEFNKLRLTDVSQLTNDEKALLKMIRESIPMPDSNTLMQKVIPASDVQKYLDGTYTQIGGFVTRAEDVTQLKTYDDIYNSLRLDYPDTAYDIVSDDTLAVIRYNTNETSKIQIPYSSEMGGVTTGADPFTGNGFTKATNGQIIPEYKMSDFARIEDGAQLIEIGKDGKETLKAIYDVDFGRFVPIE